MPMKSLPTGVAAIAAVALTAAVMATPASSKLLAGMCRLPKPIATSFGQPIFGCECSSFVWNNRGVNVGMCNSVDLDGRPLCYLHQPNNCRDAVDSQVIPGMQITKIGCLTSPTFDDVVFRELSNLLREPQHQVGLGVPHTHTGGSSREAQTAAPVDGFVPHAPTDGGDGVVVSMKSDGEGNILMPASVGDDGAELY